MSVPPARINREDTLRYILRDATSDAPAPRPVLLFLHGYDEGASKNIEDALTRTGRYARGIRDRALCDFIIVAPQMPVRGDVWFRYAADTVAAIPFLTPARAATRGCGSWRSEEVRSGEDLRVAGTAAGSAGALGNEARLRADPLGVEAARGLRSGVGVAVAREMARGRFSCYGFDPRFPCFHN